MKVRQKTSTPPTNHPERHRLTTPVAYQLRFERRQTGVSRPQTSLYVPKAVKTVAICRLIGVSFAKNAGKTAMELASLGGPVTHPHRDRLDIGSFKQRVAWASRPCISSSQNHGQDAHATRFPNHPMRIPRNTKRRGRDSNSRDGLSRQQHFQCCAFGHSATSPKAPSRVRKKRV